jgi:hypothetical protein
LYVLSTMSFVKCGLLYVLSTMSFVIVWCVMLRHISCSWWLWCSCCLSVPYL